VYLHGWRGLLGCSLISGTSTLSAGQPLLDLTFQGNQKRSSHANRQALSGAVGDYLRPIDSLISHVNRFGELTSLG